MANKKTKKSKTRHALRNDMRPSRPSTPRPKAASGDGDETGWQAVKVAGGALGAAVACAFIARQDWLPPKAVTGATAAVGAALAVGGHSDTLRAVGAGAMAAAGGQFGLLLIDDHYHTKQTTTRVASGGPTPIKKPANADGLPPGALEAAYERARTRLAMSQGSDGFA
jgi:hypothetical protein